jgi:hypothetical protein
MIKDGNFNLGRTCHAEYLFDLINIGATRKRSTSILWQPMDIGNHFVPFSARHQRIQMEIAVRQSASPYPRSRLFQNNFSMY